MFWADVRRRWWWFDDFRRPNRQMNATFRYIDNVIASNEVFVARAIYFYFRLPNRHICRWLTNLVGDTIISLSFHFRRFSLFVQVICRLKWTVGLSVGETLRQSTDDGDIGSELEDVQRCLSRNTNNFSFIFIHWLLLIYCNFVSRRLLGTRSVCALAPHLTRFQLSDQNSIRCARYDVWQLAGLLDASNSFEWSRSTPIAFIYVIIFIMSFCDHLQTMTDVIFVVASVRVRQCECAYIWL